MTAISTWTEYVALAKDPRLKMGISKSGGSGIAGRMFSCWPLGGGDNGAAPTTAVVPTKDTAGAQPNFSNSSFEQFLTRARPTETNRNGHILCDRLSHQGGLSGTTTGEQTTNLPTATLTRYTDGVGVMIGIEIYTVIGTTSTNVVARYTNQAGTGSRTTQAVSIGNTGFREGNRLILLPLQDGDYGVQSVEGVTLAASTGTAGNFGVTLFRPLFPLGYCDAAIPYVLDGPLGCGMLPKVVNDACLFWIVTANSASTFGPLLGTLHAIEP